MYRRSEPKLVRKKGLRRREGSRQARTLHASDAATRFGSGPRYAPLPVEGAATNPCTVEEQCAPSAERIPQRPQHGCTMVAARAHRRAHCDGVLLLVMEQRAGALPRMPVHVWCMHHVLTTVPFI